MIKNIRSISIALFVSFISLATYGQPSFDLFQAKVPVASQSMKERQRAAKEAFMQVLLRMSGSEFALHDPAIQKQAAKALSYVEQYQYELLNDATLQEAGFSEKLSLTFSPSIVRKILTQAQQPYWSINRPTTLVWLIEDHPEEGRRLLNQYSETSVVDDLAGAAKRRGLPLIYPLLDLDDQIAIDVEDVWEVNEEKLLEASKRYSADVILVGRFSQTSRGELWSIWQFLHAGASRSYDSRIKLDDENKDTVLGREALDPLADFLAARYAIQPRQQQDEVGSIVVKVSGIENYGDYRLSLDYLKSLAAVSKVQVSAVRRDTLLLYLDSEASIEQLIGALALDDKLQPQEQPTAGPVWQQAPQGTADNPLSFIWSS